MVRRVLLFLVCLVGSSAGPGVAQDSSVFVLPERTPAPAFTLPDLSGRPVSSAAFGGKIVILSFGATWCTTCTTELKSLENLQARFPKDLLVYFIAIDGRGEKEVKPFLEKNGYRLPTLVDSGVATGLGHAIRWVPV